MSILLTNRLLEAAEKRIEGDLTPENRANYTRIVVAGMKLALDKGPKGILASLKQSKNPLSDCATGAVNLCILMRRQSRGTMPVKAMVPAAMTLMLHALDFAERTGIIKTVGTAELSKATHTFTNTAFARFGITPQMLHGAADKLHKTVQDPAKLEKIKRAAGTVKDPNASVPTPMPANNVARETATGMINGAA